MNHQVIAAPDGTLPWVSGPLRGSVHDLAAAGIRGVIRALATTGLVTPADKAYQGVGVGGSHTDGNALWPSVTAN